MRKCTRIARNEKMIFFQYSVYSKQLFIFSEVDPSTGNVIADIKEKLKEVKTSPDSPMQKSFKASLDVPAAGIHKEVSNSGSDEVKTRSYDACIIELLGYCKCGTS